jgi:hypothetical protein
VGGKKKDGSQQNHSKYIGEFCHINVGNPGVGRVEKISGFREQNRNTSSVWLSVGCRL